LLGLALYCLLHNVTLFFMVLCILKKIVAFFALPFSELSLVGLTRLANNRLYVEKRLLKMFLTEDEVLSGVKTLIMHL